MNQAAKLHPGWQLFDGGHPADEDGRSRPLTRRVAYVAAGASYGSESRSSPAMFKRYDCHRVRSQRGAPICHAEA